MKGIINWFARNSVAANLLMVFIIVSGIFSAVGVKQEVFPEFALDLVTIQVPYLGAAPEEVEEAVNVRIDSRYRRHQTNQVDGLGRLRIRHHRAGDRRRCAQGRRRRQEQCRRDFNVS